jgi:hypothetical protein
MSAQIQSLNMAFFQHKHKKLSSKKKKKFHYGSLHASIEFLRIENSLKNFSTIKVGNK